MNRAITDMKQTSGVTVIGRAAVLLCLAADAAPRRHKGKRMKTQSIAALVVLAGIASAGPGRTEWPEGSLSRGPDVPDLPASPPSP